MTIQFKIEELANGKFRAIVTDAFQSPFDFLEIFEADCLADISVWLMSEFPEAQLAA